MASIIFQVPSFAFARASLTENVRAPRVAAHPPLDPSTDKLSIERLSGL
jgi:hypothetical protein